MQWLIRYSVTFNFAKWRKFTFNSKSSVPQDFLFNFCIYFIFFAMLELHTHTHEIGIRMSDNCFTVQFQPKIEASIMNMQNPAQKLESRDNEHKERKKKFTTGANFNSQRCTVHQQVLRNNSNCSDFLL